MSGDKDKQETFTGVRAKLSEHKKKNDGVIEFTLPHSGVVVEIPKFFNHGLWMRAQRISKNVSSKAQVIFITESVRFEGEKLTVADVQLHVDAMDMLSLIGEVFNDENDAVSDEGKK